MNEYDYTGNKTRNYFTAYLQKCIQWKRKNYLQKKEKISNIENPLEDDLQIEHGVAMEASLLLLREEERRLIYQHVFEERSFEEKGFLNGMAKERVKGVYYYAIRKIRS